MYTVEKTLRNRLCDRMTTAYRFAVQFVRVGFICHEIRKTVDKAEFPAYGCKISHSYIWHRNHRWCLLNLAYGTPHSTALLLPKLLL